MVSLAEKMRPTLDTSESLLGPAAKIWKREFPKWKKDEERSHLIFWGPPGVGKTTLAHMLAKISGREFVTLSAVKHGVKDIRDAVEKYEKPILFIDEIHRLNKAQQDVLLPILEFYEAWVLGATTEAPRVTLNPAVLSRVRCVYVGAPTAEDVLQALQKLDVSLKPKILNKVSQASKGDVRLAYHLVESLLLCENEEEQLQSFQHFVNAFTDKQHYDFASAMIKSMRGSDPDAALFYAFAAMDSGDDPLFILRRCIIFASEDVGNADPGALSLAVAAFHAFQAVGMPEGRIPLAQAVCYLASTIKSNASYSAITTVKSWREQAEATDKKNVLAPPRPLTKAGAEQYKYPHSFPDAFVDFAYLPEEIRKLKEHSGAAYVPSDRGVEARLKKRLEELWPK